MTREIKCIIAMAKLAFSEKITLFRRKLDLFKEENNKVLYLEHSFVWCWSLDTSESRLEIACKF